MKVNSGNDFQASVMGGSANIGETGTATATSATTLTNSGATFPTANLGYTGHIVVAGSSPLVYGVITSNTGTVLTVDKWYTVASPGGAAASTPGGTATYIILSGGQPAFWIALSTNATAPGASDTTLTAELNNASGGLNRAVATYAHTTGTNTYTLSKTYTANGNDGASNTIQKIGVFNASTNGTLVFETAVSNPPVLVSGDQLTITETVTT